MPSTKHANTFRYESFNQQISKIKVDLINQPKIVTETNEENESYFKENLEKWAELNCTQHFSDFFQEIKGYVFTYVHVVHHQKTIIDVVVKHLKIENTLAFEPLLDLTIHLARDLQIDFYPHFRTFFDIFVTLLDSHCSRNTEENAQKLRHIFSALSYLVKYLWRPLAKDILDVVGYYALLLDKRKNVHIRRFAAESLTYLLRKVKDHSNLIDHIVEITSQNVDIKDGVALLISETLKGVNRQLHSSAVQIIPVLLSKLTCHKKRDTNECAVEIISKSFDLLVCYIDPESFSQLLEIFYKHQRKLIQNIKGGGGDLATVHYRALIGLCQIMYPFFDYKNGYLVKQPKMALDVVKAISALCQSNDVDRDIDIVDALLPHVVSLNSALVNNCWDKFDVVERRETMREIFNLLAGWCDKEHLVLSYVTSLERCPIYVDEVVPLLLTYVESHYEPNKLFKSQECSLTIMLYLSTHLISALGTSRGETDSDLTLLPLHDAISPSILKNGRMDRFASHMMTTIQDYLDGEDYLRCSQMTSTISSIKLYATLILTNFIGTDHRKSEQRKDVAQALIIKIFDAYRSYDSAGDLKSITQGILLQAFIMDTRNDVSECVFVKHPPTFESLQELLRNDSEQVLLLKILEAFLQTLGGDSYKSGDLHLSPELLEEVMFTNLRSRNRSVRILSLTILRHLNGKCRFPLLQTITNNGASELLENSQYDAELAGVVDNVLEQCLLYDRTASTLETFRQKHIYLSNLSVDKLSKHPATREFVARYPQILECAFSFLLGVVCSENMAPVTKQLQQHLAAYLNQDSEKATLPFWKSLFGCLHKEGDSGSSENVIIGADDIFETSNNLTLDVWTLFRGKYITSQPTNEDDVLLDTNRCRDPKLLLLETLAYLNTKNLEYQNKEIIIGFQHFLKSEYNVVIDDVSEVSLTNSESGKNAPKRAHVMKTMKAYLNVFGKLKNPGGLYMCSEMVSLYKKLLAQPDADIQKLALACLSSHKLDYLIPYREHLEKLIDDITFKSELVLFNVNTDNPFIEAKHRQQLIPLVLRILYGKIQVKLSKPKASMIMNQRRSILRYLMKCEEREINLFMDLALNPLAPFLPPDSVTITEAIKKIMTTTPDKFPAIPLKKIQGALAFVDNCLSQLGSFLTFMAPRLLRIVTMLAASVYSQSCNLTSNQQYVKILRKQCINLTLTYFTKFVGRVELSAEEKEAMFEVIIWPNISNLHKECISGSSTLLKLITFWSRHPSTVHYLTYTLPNSQKCIEGADGIARNLFALVLRTLTVPNCHTKVRDEVFDLVKNLLSPPYLADNEVSVKNSVGSDSTAQTLIDQNGIELDRMAKELILPSSPLIITYILGKLTVHNETKGKVRSGKKGLALSATELEVITRISDIGERVDPDSRTDQMLGEIREKLILSLLSIIIAKQHKSAGGREEKGVKNKDKYIEHDAQSLNMLDTLRTLVDKMNIGSGFLGTPKASADHLAVPADDMFRDICVLLLNMNSNVSRVRLMRILRIIQQKLIGTYAEEATTLNYVIMLNANNPFNPDEPDYGTRARAFTYFREPSLFISHRYERHHQPMDVRRLRHWNICMLVQSCLHTLSTARTETSVRNGALDILSLLVKTVGDGNPPHLVESKESPLDDVSDDDQFGDYQVVVDKWLVPALCRGIKNMDENVFNDYVCLLEILVKNMDRCKSFSILIPLTDDDVEKDFFQNIRHIQLHRRIKALKKLKTYVESHDYKHFDRTTDQVLTHIASRFILLPTQSASKSAASNHIAIDQAVQVLSLLAARSDWNNYFHILNLYLAKLTNDIERQKLYIKTIMALLEAFPFDLSEPLGDDDSVIVAIGDESETKPVPEQPGDDTLIVRTRRVPSTTRSTICQKISRDTIPSLTKIFDTEEESYHKSVDTHEINDEKILRVPLALAIVKFIRLLPYEYNGGHSVNNIVFKLSNCLKSRAQSLRDVTRTTLTKIAIFLCTPSPTTNPIVASDIDTSKTACDSLPTLIDPLFAILTRGYQCHVLLYTIHSIMAALDERNLLKFRTTVGNHNSKPAKGGTNALTHKVLGLCIDAMFGQLAEEKEMAPGMMVKYSESRRGTLNSKTLDITRMIAKCLLPEEFDGDRDNFQSAPIQTIAQTILSPLVRLACGRAQATPSATTSKKIRACLTSVRLGLAQNASLGGPSTTYVLIYGLLTGKLIEPILVKMEREKEFSGRPPPPRSRPKPRDGHHQNPHADADCLILKPMNIRATLNRGAALVDTLSSSRSSNSGLCIFTEFGLTYLYGTLGDSKASLASPLTSLVVPLLPVLVEIANDSSVGLRTVTLALRCLSRILNKFHADPTIVGAFDGTVIESVKTCIFTLLYNYASVNMAKGETYELVVTCLRTIAILIKRLKPSVLNLGHEHLRVLLTSYFEEDLLFGVNDKKGASFALLKAILSRKLKCPELNALMKKVSRIMVQSDIEVTRLQSRQLYHQYLVHYSLNTSNKTVDIGKQVEFLVSNLAYQTECGRSSLLEFLATLIESLPPSVLSPATYSATGTVGRNSSKNKRGKVSPELLFLALVSRLANESSKQCKNMVWLTLKLLLKRLISNSSPVSTPGLATEDNVIYLFVRMAINWTRDESGQRVSFKMLGTQLAGLFIEMETDFSIEKRLFDQMSTALGHALRDALSNTYESNASSADAGNTEGKNPIDHDGCDVINTSPINDDSEAIKPYDHLTYYVLSTVRKIMTSASYRHDLLITQANESHITHLMFGLRSGSDPRLRTTDDTLHDHLLRHPHHWVRSELNLAFNSLFWTAPNECPQPNLLLEAFVSSYCQREGNATTPSKLKLRSRTSGSGKKLKNKDGRRLSKNGESLPVGDHMVDASFTPGRGEVSDVSLCAQVLVPWYEPFKIYRVADAFFRHFRSPYLTTDFVQSLALNLNFIGKILMAIHYSTDTVIRKTLFPNLDSVEEDADRGQELKVDRPPFMWFLYKVNKEFVTESKRTPKSFIKRKTLLRLVGDLVAESIKSGVIDLDRISPSSGNDDSELVVCGVLRLLKWSEPPVVPTNMAAENADAADLSQTATDIRAVLKRSLGPEKYQTLLTKVDTAVLKSRNKRKMDKAVLAMNDPFTAAKKKMKKNLKKVAIKKKKILRFKPYKKIRKSTEED